MLDVTTTDNWRQTPAWRALILRMLRLAMLATVAALLAGCIINLDGTSPGSSMDSGSSMDVSPPPVHRLPPPSVSMGDLPVLTADQQLRQDEVDQYVWQQYQAAGWQIVVTIQTPIGDIIDWLDENSVTGSQEGPPPKPTKEEMPLADGVQLSLTELDLFPELRGPPVTIPVMRPSFAAYVSGLSGASSLEDYLNNHVVPGDPSGPGRLYAGIISDTKNLGASTWINAFGGLIEPGTLSVLEMAIGCRNEVTKELEEQVGIAASRDWTTNDLLSGNFGDSVLRIQVEFMTHGADWRGTDKGGWEGTVTNFIPAKGALYPPGMAILNPSTISGPQFESSFWIRLWNGNWWVGWNGSWLGYYGPRHDDKDQRLFNDLFSSNACHALWYGEVYDPAATPTKWTSTDMGSGQLASAGFGKAANFRNPSYIDLSGMSQWPDNASPAPGNNPACYTKTDLFALQSPWDRFFYLGGPGGDAPTGDCPEPH